jgi:hypothetical protein
MQKRGITQIDWAISLSIFLLYVAWFFIYMNPSFVKDDTGEVLEYMVESRFKSEYDWNITKLPLFIYSNVTNEYEPVIVEFNYALEKNKTLLGNDINFIYDNGKIIFLGNIINETNIFWILNSIENYNKTDEITDLNSYSTYATNSKNLSVYFENAFFSSIHYKNRARINNTKIYVNDELMNTTGSYSEHNFVAIYKINSDVFNHTTYVFARNPRVYNYFNFNTEASYNLRISTNIYNYNNYYATNAYYGNKTSLPNCTSEEPYSFENEYLNFYNTGTEPDAMTIAFNKTAAINLCYDGIGIKANISFTIANETWYKIEFNEGDYRNITLSRYNYAFGIAQKETGLYLSKIEEMDYNELKLNWSYPVDRDFKITVWNITRATITNRTEYVIRDIGPNKTNIKDVTVNEWDEFILTKEGIKYPALISVKSW